MAQQKSKSNEENAGTDVIKLLKDEQKQIKRLFREFESICDLSGHLPDKKRNARKAEIVTELCGRLGSYVQAADRIFFPAVGEAIALHGKPEGKQFLVEVVVEHAGTRILLAQLAKMKPTDTYYEASVRVLRKYIKHHAKVLKGRMLKIMEEAKLDVQALAGEMGKFKAGPDEKKKGASGSPKKTAPAKDL
ncbi:MAG: hypothetical protein ABI167_09165 [Nitrosospira sp.]